MLASVKGAFRAGAEWLVAGLAGSGIRPTHLTLLGFALNAIVAAILGAGFTPLGGVLVLVVGLFDTLDGALARVAKQSTTFGAFIDSTLDRYSEALIVLGIVYAALQHADQAVVLLGFAMIVGSLMVSYSRARAEGLGMRAEVGLVPRPERVVILGVGLIVGQTAIALAILAVLTNVTAVQRILHVYRLTRATPPPPAVPAPAPESAPPTEQSHPRR